MRGFPRSCLAGAAATLTLMAGCDTVTSDRSLQWVSVNEAKELGVPKGFSLAGQKSVAFVDPRNPTDFAAGHVEGAVLVPFAALREGAAEQLQPYQILVVYDSDHDDVVARSMSKRLMEFDRWDVYTLRGGLRAWDKAGEPVGHGLPQSLSEGSEGVASEAMTKPLYGRQKR